MSQDSYNKDEKQIPRFPPNRNRDENNNNNKRGPRFSIYWIYAIIFAILIGFGIYGPFSQNMAKTNFIEFREMIKRGDVHQYEIVDNKKLVKIYLTEDRLKRYENRLSKNISGNYSKEGPHFYFKYSGDFEKQMSEFVITSYSIHYTKLYDTITSHCQ